MDNQQLESSTTKVLKYTRTKKKRRVHKICNIIILLLRRRTMKIGQIDVLSAVTRTKKKRRVTHKDSLNPFPNDKF